jgi:hypothetical protein
MTKEEQNRSRFVDEEKEKAKAQNKAPKPSVKQLENEGGKPKEENRPAVGKGKSKFPQKYDPVNNNGKRKEGVQAKKPITCYNCGKEGHIFVTCSQPRKEKAVTRLAQGDDPFMDSPESEPDFETPALANILDAHWETFENEELADGGSFTEEDTTAAVNVLTHEQLDPRLPQKRVAFPVEEGFVAPVQPSGPNPEPIMAAPLEQRRLNQQQRAEIAAQQRRNPTRGAATRPEAPALPPQASEANGEFRAKWVPTKEILKHCPPNLVADLKKAASDAVAAQTANPAMGAVRTAKDPPATGIEKLIITPRKVRPPLTKVAGRVGGINGVPRYVCIDSGANVGMIDEQAVLEAGLSSEIRKGRPTFSTADGKIASGLGWVDAKIGLGTRLEVYARFVVAKDLDYQVLLGTNALWPLHGLIDYHTNRFKFRLPESGEWRSLPLIVTEADQKKAERAVAKVSEEDLTLYVEQVLCSMTQNQIEPHPSDQDDAGRLAASSPTIADSDSKMPTLVAATDLEGLPDLKEEDSSDSFVELDEEDSEIMPPLVGEDSSDSISSDLAPERTGLHAGN